MASVPLIPRSRPASYYKCFSYGLECTSWFLADFQELFIGWIWASCQHSGAIRWSSSYFTFPLSSKGMMVKYILITLRCSNTVQIRGYKVLVLLFWILNFLFWAYEHWVPFLVCDILSALNHVSGWLLCQHKVICIKWSLDPQVFWWLCSILRNPD